MHWCLGMYASGSTWVFNVAMQAAAAFDPATPVHGRFAASAAELDGIDAPGIRHIVKTHHLDPALENAIAARTRNILLVLRDPRDAVTSLMLYQRHSFAQALDAVAASAAICGRYAADPRALVLRYETGFIDEPATIDRIAATFGAALSPDARAGIFAATRRAAIEAHIGRLADLPTALRDHRSGDIVDLATQWHTHHAGRTGEVGRWRRILTPAQADAVVQRNAPALAALAAAAAAASAPAAGYRLTVGRYGILDA